MGPCPILAQQGWESTIPPDFQGLGLRNATCMTAVSLASIISDAGCPIHDAVSSRHEWEATNPTHRVSPSNRPALRFGIR